MRNLIVYAHPNPESFNNGILETVVRASRQNGYEPVVRDLYAMKFHPVLQKEDLEGIHSGKLPRDIAAEQEHIRGADMITFVYPVWWTGLPAMVKGYIDRVYAYGFAYAMDDKGVVPLLADKKVIVLNTTGTPYDVYQENGMLNSLRQTSDGGIFGFCGMQVLHHAFFGGVPYVDAEARKMMLEEVEAVLNRFQKK